jgi:hypothetical protein
MTDNLGYGYEKRRQGNLDTLAEKVTFRDSFRDMLDSVTKPFNECTQILVDNIKLDPYFAEFYQWSLENNIPVVVLSGGMEPIIHADPGHRQLRRPAGREGDEPGAWLGDFVPAPRVGIRTRQVR